MNVYPSDRIRLPAVNRCVPVATRFLWVSVVLLSAVLAAQSDRQRVRVGGGYSVPWAYLGPDGTPTGFYVEVMKEAARREGLAFEIVFRKDGPEKALRSGEIDLWSAAVPTEERRKSLYFSTPWWSQDHYIGVMSSSSIHGVDDLNGKVVVHSATPPFTVDLATVLPGARLQTMNDLRARFQAVCDGRAEAALFYHETSLFSITGSNDLADCRERGLRLIPLGRVVMETAVAALPENRALADRIRLRIDEMRKDQTLARLAASPLTGTQALTQMLQTERTESQHRLLQLSVGFLSLIVLIGGAAYFRLRRANRQTREALAVAEQASRVKSEFLATMSHEIRTPLTAVVGYMDMLMGTPLRHDQRRYALEVKQATASLLTLMTTILGYARPVVSLTAEDETFEPANVMDDCLAAVLLAAEEKGLIVTMELAPGIPARFLGDAVRLRQAVLNMMGNAVKFTPDGWVRVRASYADGLFSCTIADSGPGIPADKRAQIFEPFTQLDSTDNRQYGGVGLGLAIVAVLCKQLGGNIRVDDVRQGAQFTLTIPYSSPDPASRWLGPPLKGVAVLLLAESGAAAIFEGYLREAGLDVLRVRSEDELARWVPPADGTIHCFIEGGFFGVFMPAWRNERTRLVLVGTMSYLANVGEVDKSCFDDILPFPVSARSVIETLRPPAVVPLSAVPAPVRSHVLVVDDNAVNRRVLSALLEKLGCRVDTVNDGREAVDAVLRRRYSVVLMDCQMPVLNGYEATAEIRRHSLPVSDVPICGVSASMDTDTQARCEASGMDEFMPKPVTLDMLRDLMTRVAARQIIEENLRLGD